MRGLYGIWKALNELSATHPFLHPHLRPYIELSEEEISVTRYLSSMSHDPLSLDRSVRGVGSTPILGNLLMVWMVDQHLEGVKLGNRWQVSLGKTMCKNDYLQECTENVETLATQVKARWRALTEDGALRDQVQRMTCVIDVGSVFVFSSSCSAGSGHSGHC